MLEEELHDFSITEPVYEIDVERHKYIAEAYGIMTLPTLITGNNVLSGLPTESDLRSFILQSFPGVCATGNEPSRYRVFSGMQERLRAQREEYLEEQPRELHN